MILQFIRIFEYLVKKSAYCKKEAAPPPPMLRACDVYTRFAVEYAHDPNIFKSLN